MKSLKLLSLLSLALSCASGGNLLAQDAINWGSRGLPPGLTVVVDNPTSGSVKIQGTPTRAGTYSAIIYPIADGVFGDMHEISFRILPAGLNLPTFYPYQRRAATGDGTFTALCSGGNRIFGRVGLNRLGFTSNGQDFTVRGLPSGVSGMDSFVSAATAANQTLAIFRTTSVGMYTMPIFTNKIFQSSNTRPFTEEVLPPELVSNSSAALALASDGIAWFYLIAVSPGTSYGGPAPSPATPVARIWRRALADTTWSGPVDVSLPAPADQSYIYSFNRLEISVASVANSLGRVALMTLNAQYPPMYGGVASNISTLIRSTDAGASWSTVSSAPQLNSITYDAKNARFTGSGDSGVWSSANGETSWSRRTTSNVGAVTYSAHFQLLLSTAAGVSSDGVNWMPYNFGGNYTPAPGFSRVLSTSDGKVLFWESMQLSPVYVPSAWPKPVQIGQVNSAFTYELKVD